MGIGWLVNVKNCDYLFSRMVRETKRRFGITFGGSSSGRDYKVGASSFVGYAD